MQSWVGNRLMGSIQPRVSPVLYRNTSHSPRKDMGSTRKDFRAEFYEHYRKEADEYDREFMKMHDEDLNTTLIFVRLQGDTADTC